MPRYRCKESGSARAATAATMRVTPNLSGRGGPDPRARAATAAMMRVTAEDSLSAVWGSAHLSSCAHSS